MPSSASPPMAPSRGAGAFQTAAAGQDRHAGGGGDFVRALLVAHRRDRIRRGTDPDEARRLHRADEAGVLGEEAVARMHGVGVVGEAASRMRCCTR